MRVAELHEWVIGVATDTLRETPLYSLSTPTEHADIANGHDESTYPFVGVVPINFTPLDNGLGNSSLVPTAIQTNGGDTVGVEETLRREFTLEVSPVTNDDAYKRDQLVDELTIAFAQRIEANDVPHDITDLSVGETTPSDRPDSFVRGSGVTLTGRLHTASERALPTADVVSFEVDVTNDETTTDAYPEKYN